MKLHSGYNSCEMCAAVGTYRDRKVVFPFYACKIWHPKHHIGRWPFEVLDIGMINCFPLDYMHMVCLRVCKRLLNLWCPGPSIVGVVCDIHSGSPAVFVNCVW